MTARPVHLPRWPAGRLCLIDLIPQNLGAPFHGAPVILSCREGFFEAGSSMTWISDWSQRSGRLEETLDDAGQPHLTVNDSLFRGLMPSGRAAPLIFAGYHMPFLRRLLGGPHDHPPYDLCLYTGIRHFCPWISDFGLQLAALELVPENINLMTRAGPSARQACAETLLDLLLHKAPANQLVALSGGRVPPPPDEEPLAGMPGWRCMTSGFVFTAD